MTHRVSPCVCHTCGIAVNQKVGHSCGMARDDLHFRLRIPEDLKLRVEKAAKDNHRSMTAEIVATLEERYPQPEPITDYEFLAYLAEHLVELVELRASGAATPEECDEYDAILRLLKKMGVTIQSEEEVGEDGKFDVRLSLPGGAEFPAVPAPHQSEPEPTEPDLDLDLEPRGPSMT